MRIPHPLFFLPFLLSLFPFAHAASGTLFTDTVSYCDSTSRAIIVDAFDLAYHQANESITFSFSIASVEDNLNVSVRLFIDAYGRTIDESINLCDILQGVICPLPQVNFTGYGTYPIPSSLTNRIPSIAYTVPDLDAYARVELVRTENGETAACVQATLSNGHSTRHLAVAIASGLLSLVALLVGLFHSCIDSPSPAQYRWFDILYLFQTAVSTGLLNLDYPRVFTKFVQNFAWSFALFHSGSMQRSINSMRMKTGGHLNGTAGPDIQFISQTLPVTSSSSLSLNTLTTVPQFSNFISSLNEPANKLQSRSVSVNELYVSQTNGVNTGIPYYVESLDIPAANAYTTIFFFFLAFIGIAIVFHAILFLIVAIVDRGSGDRINWATRLRRMYGEFTIGNSLRVCLIWFLPIWIFGFYQFKIRDSGLAIFFAVLGILLTLVPLATAFVLSILRHRRPSSTAPTISPLYTSFRWFYSVGMIYRPYRQRFHFFWFMPLVFGMIVRSAFIAFAPASPWTQVIGTLAVEVIVLVLLLACRPHKDRKGDWLAPFLAFCRCAAFGLLIAFIPSMSIDPIIRTVIGIVEIAVIGIPTVLLFFGLIWNAGYGYLWRRHTHRIEDGLEVERFVSDDDDSQTRTAMAHVDANNFVSANSHHGNDGPTLNRRTSLMEPVNNVYGNGDRHVPHGQGQNDRDSMTVYDHNPAGQGYEEKQFQAQAQGQTGPADQFSRRSSRTSMYYTPNEGARSSYHTPANEGWEGQQRRDQYFGKY